MASVFPIKINGTTIKSPPEGGFSISRFNLTKSGRLGDGTMQIKLIAKKRKFSFKYDVINGTDLALILSIIDGTTMTFTLSYYEFNILKTALCYVGEIPSTLFRRGKMNSQWQWKNVAFELIEI